MDDGVYRASTALAEALQRADAAGAAQLYAVDGRLLTPTARLIAGRLEIEAYWRAGLAFGLSGVVLEPDELQIGRRTAVEIGRYAFTVTADAAGPVCERGKYLVLHRRQPDGTWCRSVDVFNPDMKEER
jgi:uncharacterized protein (TIGR02246 family)